MRLRAWPILMGLVLLSAAAPPVAEEPPRPNPNQDIFDLNEHGHYAEAEAASRERLPQVESRHGTDSLEVADLLDELVLALARSGKVKDGEALRLAERAVGIREAHASDRPGDVARSLIMMAQVQEGLDDVEGAKATYERALAAREAAGGPDQKELGPILVNLGNTLTRLGDYATARTRYQRALDIYRRTLPPRHRLFGSVLLNLANIDFYLGDYEAARAGYQEAVEVLEASLGPEHPHVGDTLSNLANVMTRLGDYPSALETFPRGIAITRKALGEHDRVAHALRNYAVALRLTGQHAEARRCLEEALAIQRKVLVPGSPRLAPVLTNLSSVEIDERDYVAARGHLEQAVAIVEAAHGPESINLVPELINLAHVLLRLGEYEACMPVVERGRALAAQQFSPDHPSLAYFDTLEARLRAHSGDLEAARRLTEKALAAKQTRFDAGHQEVVELRAYLAVLAWALGDRAAALQAAAAAGADLQRSLRETVRVLPEARALELAALRTHPEGVLFTGLLDDPERRSGWLRACLEWTLREKGLILEEISTRRLLSAPGDSRLARASQRLAALWNSGDDASDPEQFRADLERARREREEAEAALAGSARLRRLRPGVPVDAQSVAAAIPEGSVLIELVLAPVRPDARNEEAEPSRRYVALRLDREGRMDFADLGAAETVDGLVERWRTALKRSADAGAGEPAARELDSASKVLSTAVWLPLARLAGDARAIFLVPDGSLHKVQFSALPSDDGRFVAESGPAIHLLSTGRDLPQIRESPAAAGSGMNLLALGGVPFGAGRASNPERASSLERGLADCRSPKNVAWPPLPDSRREVDGIGGLFRKRGPVLPLTGASATEARLKEEAPRHEVLHLATHGFFLEDDCGGAAPNPLLLSGLVLAEAGGAANRATGGAASRAAGEDGLLTAEELATLDLSAVRLTVLSACNTGLGKVTSGEGVFGLRRAFEIAGSRSLVMSLWPVPDRQGRQWMTSFYTAWLKGAPAFEAARQANLDGLRKLRAREAAPHPYLWCGYVTAGDWRGALPDFKGTR